MRTTRWTLTICLALAGGTMERPVPAATTDAVPAGTVAFFNGIDDGCPSGWSVPVGASGRLVVGVTVGNTVGGTVGPALSEGEDPTHKHDFETTVKIKKKGVTALNSCCNHSGAKKTNLDLEGKTDESTSGLPFVQLLICEAPDPS